MYFDFLSLCFLFPDMATRWGIVSAGKISSDFVTALSLLPKEEHCVRHFSFVESENIIRVLLTIGS